MSFLACLFAVLAVFAWGTPWSAVFGVLAIAGVAWQARGWR